MPKHFLRSLLSVVLIITVLTPAVAHARPAAPGANPAWGAPLTPAIASHPMLPASANAPVAAEHDQVLHNVAPTPMTGRLLLSPTIDADSDPLTNPVDRVPVARVGGEDQANDVYYAPITLAAEVIPADPVANPAGVEVTFHVWHETAPVDLQQTGRADAWGAAHVEMIFDDLHLAGRYFYQAGAPGFGETPVRSFSFDTSRFSSEVRLGAAGITAAVDDNGRLAVDITSDTPIDDAASAIELIAVSLIPTSTTPSAPERKLLPSLLARKVDANHGRAEIFLDAGDYLLLALVHSGSAEAHSLPILVHVPQTAPPPVASVEAVYDPDENNETVLAQYRTPDGDVALMRRNVSDLPSDTPEQKVFQQVRRTGAFRWVVDSYAVETQVVTGDGKKSAHLDGVSYDPNSRRYDIVVQSQMDQAVEDKLTVQVYGPGGVVIYEETVPILLNPQEPLHYSVSVPTDLGEPQGLRIIVHDPFLEDWIIKPTQAAIEGLFNGLLAIVPEGLTISAGAKVGISVLQIDIASASITCVVGAGCSAGLGGIIFTDSWSAAVDAVTVGVRNYLRNLFGVATIEEAFRNLLAGLELGTGSLSGTLGVRYDKNLFNPINCPDPAVLEAAKAYVNSLGASLSNTASLTTHRFKKLSEKLQRDPWPVLPFPGFWFLAVRFSPIGAFKLDAGKSGDFSVYGELQFEIGIQGTLLLNTFSYTEYIVKLWDFKDKVFEVYDTIEAVMMVGPLFSTLYNAAVFGQLRGSCKPPLPGGRPDDRRDASLNNFLALPAGISDRLLYLQDQVATAHRLSLARAETYWTVHLRQTELADFALNPTRTISQTIERDAIFTEGALQMQGLISGTIPLDPGQTITDAVGTVFGDVVASASNTQSIQRFTELRDALDFAQRQYNALNGQELALQHELRTMLAQGGVGVLDGGLVTWALTALNTLGVQGKPVQVLPGLSSSDLPDSRYYSPYAAPSVLIVPSGGLARYILSREAQLWLETYVASGGTLVVLAQADSVDWSVLPGGQVQGLGFKQDILCKTASVRIVNESPWIKGIGRVKPNIQVDGSFTAWPANTKVVLMRTTGNKLPAMIEYDYGNGHVVATSAYPDFYINGMQSVDDIIFARTLFALAYLTATGQTVAATAPAPGAATALTLELRNPWTRATSSAYLYRDYYGDRIGESWRWAAHQPAPLRAAQRVSFNPSLPGGSTRTVAFNFNAPLMAGIFRTGATFCTGGSVYTVSSCKSGPNNGPFYEVTSSLVPPPGFSLQADQQDYAFGESASIIATVTNNKPVVRTIELRPLIGLTAPPVFLSLNPGATAQHTWTTRVYKRTALRVGLYEEATQLSEMALNLRVVRPSLGLAISDPQIGAGLAATAVATTTVGGVFASAINWQVRLDNSLVISTTTPLSTQGQYSVTTTSLALPPAPAGSNFTVRIRLPGATDDLAKTIPVLAPALIDSIVLTTPLTIDEPNPGAVLAVIKDLGHAGTAQAHAFLRRNSDNAVLASGPSVALALGGGLQNVLLDVPLPATLDLDESYSIVAEVVGRASGTGTPITHRKALPLNLAAPNVDIGQSIRRVGQFQIIHVSPPATSAGLPLDGIYEVTLSAASYPFSQTTMLSPVFTSGRSATLSLPVSNLTRGDKYDVSLRSVHLANWIDSDSFFVPPQKIDYTADEVEWTALNSGGIDTTLNGTLQLLDPEGLTVMQIPVSTTLNAGDVVAIPLALPDQLRSGLYNLQWQGVDHQGIALSYTYPIQLDRLEVMLTGRTDQPGYQADQMASATATVTTTGALQDARLRLQVELRDGISPESSGSTPTNTVLRTDWLTVTVGMSGTVVVSYTVPFTNPNLMDDSRARGELVLESTLFSHTPAGESSPDARHVLARSSYPFVIDNAADGLSFFSDRQLYRANMPGYAPDDAASAVALGGVLRNTTTNNTDVDVTIIRSDGATMLSQTLSAVPVNHTRTFGVVDPAPPAGTVTYTASTSLGDSDVVTITVQPATLETHVSASPESVAQYESATVQVTVTNTGSVPAYISPYVNNEYQHMHLEPGQTVTLNETREMEYPAIGIWIEGDLQDIFGTTIEVRNESAYGWAGVTHPLGGRALDQRGPLDGVPMPKGEDSGVVLKLFNQPYTYPVIVDYVISGTQYLSGTQLMTLQPGENDLIIPMSDAPLGSYQAGFIVYHARLGRLLTEASVNFELVQPITELALDATAMMLDDIEAARIDAMAYGAYLDFPWNGTLRFSGAIEAEHELTIQAWTLPQVFSATLSLQDLSGPQPVTVALVNPDGSVAVSRTLTIQAAPSNAPGATLGDVGVTPGGIQRSQAGTLDNANTTATLTITAQVNNAGPAGDAVLEVLAFDQLYEIVGQVPGAASLHSPAASTILSQTVPVPPDLLAGSYPIVVRLGNQEVEVDAQVAGPEIDLRQSLDAAAYEPFSQATWTVELEGVAGQIAQYDVELRYGSEAYTQTVTIGAGQIVQVPWTFEVGPIGERATVLVLTHPLNAEQTRHSLIIDSQWVPVIEDPQAWLESDQERYNAGEAVHLTYHLTEPTGSAMVIRPGDQSTGAPLIWSSLTISPNVTLTRTVSITNPVTGLPMPHTVVISDTTLVQGDFSITYDLPAMLPTGRYFFTYLFDGQERTLPIDVFGVDLQVEELTVVGSENGKRGTRSGERRATEVMEVMEAGDAVSIAAKIRLNVPLASARLAAYVLGPDGEYLSLGPSAVLTTSLPAGVTPIALSGLLDAKQPGAHQVVFQVRDATTRAVLGGDSAFVDVGRASINSLTTDQGTYAPGEPGTGQLDIYGFGPTQVVVTATNGSTLLNTMAALNGFDSFSFAIPTATEGDYLLVARTVDSAGNQDNALRAYAVPLPLDTEPPVLVLSYPNTHTVLYSNAPTMTLTVQGQVSDNRGPARVYVNGQLATTLAEAAFSAPVELRRGANTVSVVALDDAGNYKAAPVISIIVTPLGGVALSPDRINAAVGQELTYETILTSTGTISNAQLVQILPPGRTSSVTAHASSGNITGIAQGVEGVTINWRGDVDNSAPVSIAVTVTLSSSGVLTSTATAFWGWGLADHVDSSEVNVTTPLAVLIASFSATQVGSHALLAWETISEVDHLGFNVYRGPSSTGPWSQVNIGLIPSPSPGSTAGQAYELLDPAALLPGVTWYRLEAIDAHGLDQEVGLVSIEQVALDRRLWLPMIIQHGP